LSEVAGDGLELQVASDGSEVVVDGSEVAGDGWFDYPEH